MNSIDSKMAMIMLFLLISSCSLSTDESLEISICNRNVAASLNHIGNFYKISDVYEKESIAKRLFHNLYGKVNKFPCSEWFLENDGRIVYIHMLRFIGTYYKKSVADIINTTRPLFNDESVNAVIEVMALWGAIGGREEFEYIKNIDSSKPHVQHGKDVAMRIFSARGFSL